MRDLPQPLRELCAKEDTSLCYLFKLTLKNGSIYRYTDSSQSVDFAGVIWRADPGINISAIRDTRDSLSQTATIEIGYAPDMLTEEDARRGGLEGAQHQVLLLDYRRPEVGAFEVFSGNVDRLTTSNKSSCSVDLTGWQGKFSNLNGVYSLKCRNVFCDKGCKLNIDAFKVPFELTADSVDGVTLVTTGNLSPKSGDFGSIEWTSGKNVGNITPVATNDATTIDLTQAPGYRPRAGDAGWLRAGCDYYKATCKNRYDNLENFQAEPSVPQGETTSADKTTQGAERIDTAKPPVTNQWLTYSSQSGYPTV